MQFGRIARTAVAASLVALAAAACSSSSSSQPANPAAAVVYTHGLSASEAAVVRVDAMVGNTTVSANAVPLRVGEETVDGMTFVKTFYVTWFASPRKVSDLTIEDHGYRTAADPVGCGDDNVFVFSVPGARPIVPTSKTPQQRENVWLSGTEAPPNEAGYDTQAVYMGDSVGVVAGPTRARDSLATDPALGNEWAGAGVFNASGVLVAFNATAIKTGATKASQLPASQLTLGQFIQTGHAGLARQLARYGSVVGLTAPPSEVMRAVDEAADGQFVYVGSCG
jgi:hypothetical protein